MQKTRVLTGITTTGTPHLGNYVGAIKPAIAASQDPKVQSYFFLADLHALIKCQDPKRVQESRLEIAATWLALGLDTDNAVFYRQSDIPEITELTWMLSCVCAKGLMNRAHAYKASVADNEAAGQADPDKGVTMGLFSYPVLMAADILMFNANKVPVGRDQIQHIEMARDMGGRFNHLFKGQYFTLPEAQVDRFMMKVHIDYPSKTDELEVMRRMTNILYSSQVNAVLGKEEIFGIRSEINKVQIAEPLENYIIELVFATRSPEKYGLREEAKYIQFGASPRASINLNLAARAVAFMDGRDYVLPEDIKEIAEDVLNHRIIINYEAEADNVSTRDLIHRIMEKIPLNKAVSFK